MTLLRINGHDYTTNVQKSSTVNQEQEYEEWKDVKYNKHRTSLRERVSGTFKLVFYSNNGNDYARYISDLATVKDRNKIRLTVHIQNTNEEREIIAYYTNKITSQVEVGDVRIDRVTLTIEEA